MKKLIVIEGLDKVGKTTLIDTLKFKFHSRDLFKFHSKELRETMTFFNFPNSEFSYLRGLTKDFENTTPYLRDLAHALSHGLTYLEIEKIKDSVDYIICDRYYFSSFVYSDKKRMKKIEYDWMDPKPLVPDLLIYLYSDQGYPSFANNREDVDPNDSMSIDERMRIHVGYLEMVNTIDPSPYGKKRISICVDNLTPEEVYNKAISYILS